MDDDGWIGVLRVVDTSITCVPSVRLLFPLRSCLDLTLSFAHALTRALSHPPHPPPSLLPACHAVTSPRLTFPPQSNVKLTDFGFSVMVRDPMKRLKIFCGTPSYMAPEITQR